MRTLIVIATREELSVPTVHEVLVTGIGMVPAAIAVTRALAQESYDRVLHMGIAGAFTRKLKLGSVVEVVSDQLAEVGVEDGDAFRTFEDLGMTASRTVRAPRQTDLPQSHGITVNTVHGHEDSIATMRERYRPDIETMEGAACMLACESFSIPCLHIRAISNYVERRNRAAWDIPLAIRNLNAYLQSSCLIC